MAHLRCVGWAAVAALLGLALQAYGQDPETAALVAVDPTVGVLVELLRGGGLPAVLALLAWWARGAVGGGIPLEVRLHPEDRRELARLRRALERADDDSESDHPPPRAA